MSVIITANELKTQGVSALQKATAGGEDALISVHGKTRYVVMPVETYNYLRECELDAALRESKSDISAGLTVKESVEDHINRISRG